MSQHDREELGPEKRTQLEALMKALLEELRRFLEDGQEARRPVELEQEIGRVSRGDALQQQQMALANARQAKERIERLEAALLRLELGEYGDCVDCGEPIGFARLRAVPEALRCVECS